MYFIKTKGTNKVPDFVQIRDENYALIEQIKISSLEKDIKKIFNKNINYIFNLIKNAEYEKLTKIENKK